MTVGVIRGPCSQVLIRGARGESLGFLIRSNLAGTDDHSGER